MFPRKKCQKTGFFFVIFSINSDFLLKYSAIFGFLASFHIFYTYTCIYLRAITSKSSSMSEMKFGELKPWRINCAKIQYLFMLSACRSIYKDYCG